MSAVRVPKAPVAASLTVFAGMVALEAAYGAPISDILAYLLYQVGFRVLPGVLLLRVLSSRPGSGLRQLALGWALGCGLETGAFMLAGALGAPGAFAVYPLLVVFPAGVIQLRQHRRRTLPTTQSHVSSGTTWAIAVVSLLAIGVLAALAFSATPLPGTDTINLNRDILAHTGLAAEAKHHWPISDPNVAGEPYPYHWFVHIHMAGASRITGSEVSMVYFRLFPLPAVVLVVLLFALAGASLARSIPVGLAAAVLALFVGDLELEASGNLLSVPFLGVFLTLVHASPSFLFGLASFLALIIVIGERLITGPEHRGSPGDWALIILLTLAASNAKVAILSLVSIALALFGGWQLLRTRRFPTTAFATGLVATGVLLVTYLSQYAGHSSGLRLDPFGSFNMMLIVQTVKGYANDVLPSFPMKGVFLGVVGVALGLIGLLGAQLGGAAFALDRGATRSDPGRSWLTTLLAAGLLFLVFVVSPGGGNQLYFVFFGIAAGCLLAASGLRAAYRRRPDRVERPWVLCGILGCWIVFLVLTVKARDLGLDFLSRPDARGRRYVVTYGAAFLSLGLLAFAGGRLLRPGRWWAPVLVVGALIAIGTMGVVTNQIVPALDANREATRPAPGAVTREGYRTLRWLEANTPADGIFAANHDDPDRFSYSAFAERRSYVGAWSASRAAIGDYDGFRAGKVDPYAGRRALVRAAFAGNPRALSALAGAGVDYLLIDSDGNLPLKRRALERRTRLLYESGNLEVRRLEPKD